VIDIGEGSGAISKSGSFKGSLLQQEDVSSYVRKLPIVSFWSSYLSVSSHSVKIRDRFVGSRPFFNGLEIGEFCRHNKQRVCCKSKSENC